ncbi:hypothetical protein JCM15457_454 [Liquorilactobacillus sucicola DSM 21376 = JCM 15457]|uniref:LITAF domain-containing protein n=1 Tax=Liquorilactobacillus sucicola DSM 21376 = JCM 15457 TaxID=1423806 RepID=A0A023CUU1_9LACO|nr:hypothetical protein [Liquorilactobacillus sucicola]KRN05503.1 hypothetical protein FD15_GL002059 [Liquorilactobacillus sucicola DSM 21376 = JCM 15457]GAJ25584.1 hypothetical protein JCM15457_454 [Liquorilactobacillus sucicola DSM 21376 = JCM 15457]
MRYYFIKRKKKKFNEFNKKLNDFSNKVDNFNKKTSLNHITGHDKKKAVNKLVCPKCGSSNIQFAGNNRKSFSVDKAVAGTVLTGGVGALAGFIGKTGEKIFSFV